MKFKKEMIAYALFLLQKDTTAIPASAAAAITAAMDRAEVSPVFGEVADPDVWEEAPAAVLPAAALPSTTKATGERESKVAVIVPLPALDSTTSHAPAAVS